MTPTEARLNGYTVTAWCGSPACRRGVQLDLLALELANPDVPLQRLARRMRCERCGEPASSVDVTAMRVGKSEVVARYFRQVPVVGTVFMSGE